MGGTEWWNAQAAANETKNRYFDFVWDEVSFSFLVWLYLMTDEDA
jgi:hypothetical protein